MYMYEQPCEVGFYLADYSVSENSMHPHRANGTSIVRDKYTVHHV